MSIDATIERFAEVAKTWYTMGRADGINSLLRETEAVPSTEDVYATIDKIYRRDAEKKR